MTATRSQSPRAWSPWLKSGTSSASPKTESLSALIVPALITATNPNSTWLFPGRRAGQPLHPTSIWLRLTTLGIPTIRRFRWLPRPDRFA
jgi:hypothetical protein